MLNHKEIDKIFNYTKTSDNNTQNVSSSRAVQIAKILLPIIAGVFGMTLLILPTLKKDINEFAIDLIFPEGDIEKMNIEKTTLYYTDTNGKVNNFIAKEIKEISSDSQTYNLISPEANIPLNNDEWINIRSSTGIYNHNSSSLDLPKQVELFYNKGLNIITQDFFYDFSKSVGFSRKPVIGDGFLGKFNSEGIEISTQNNILSLIGKTTIFINEETLKKGN